MDLLLIPDGNKSHYMYIKDFNRFMRYKTKNKSKQYFCKCGLQCFSSEKVLIEYEENCLVINGKKSVKLKSGSISFKNYFKYLFLLKSMLILNLLKGVKSSNKNNGSYTEKYQDHIPCSFAYKVVCIDNNFSKKVVLYEGKNAAYRFIEAIIEEYDNCKKNDKKIILIRILLCLQKRKISINRCWICGKLFDVGDDKVRDHCHITGKYRDAVHWSCNNNLKLTKRISVIFHNLRGYDSHLIIKEIW